MNSIKDAAWIKNTKEMGETVPVFRRNFSVDKQVKNAVLEITSLGVYEAVLNGTRVGDFILAPGWTSYFKRLQYQEYDVTQLLHNENTLDVCVGPGWCFGRINKNLRSLWNDATALLASLTISYEDGTFDFINTDETWRTSESPIRASDFYDGEIFDARVKPSDFKSAGLYTFGKDMLIPQEGEIVREQERLAPVALLHTPAGETVVDFGQNLTGYVEIQMNAKPGDVVEYSHAEVLDKDGNFYTANLRSAKQKITYICGGGEGTYKPHLTFQGFRYIRLEQWPGDVNLQSFTAIVVHSDMKRTGHFECSSALVNKLYSNIIWGQKGNYLDIPTDCPQRDERLGWTGDAQVFVRAASYNFNVERFFIKWLRDLAADQDEDGGMPHVVPTTTRKGGSSAAWGDAAVMCPWQLYLSYGNLSILSEQFESMRKWIEYIRAHGSSEYLWDDGKHFGDWLDLEAPEGAYAGATDKNLIACAFYAYSTSLLIKAGHALGRDMAEYERLHDGIVKAFRETYLKDGLPVCNTQTAHVLTLRFGLAEDSRKVAASLAEKVRKNGNKLTTGFVGTPYLLHVLTENGYEELAYSLLLQEEFPSWLYSVRQGATTIWEHWDGLKPDGSMWSPDMNSFNHYAYGAVADWMFGVMAGIQTDENQPGFRHIIFKPVTDPRLSYVKASIDTRFGTVASEWKRSEGKTIYLFSVPQGCTATVDLAGNLSVICAGTHEFIQ